MALTKDSEKAFKIIYCEYKHRRKSGFTKADSIQFEDGSISKLKCFSDWLRPDIESAIEELVSSGCLKEDILGNISITNNGISYMENKPKDFFNDLSNLFDLASIFL